MIGSMRHSILLPTRNGGRFLRECVRSVLASPRRDIELVVSDNCNSDETPDVLREAAADPRLVAVRSDRVLSVAENWNNALRHARGEFVCMLGDDDILLPGYFDAIDRLVAEHGADAILYNGFSYVAPGSLSGNEASLFGRNHFRFEAPLDHEGPMSPETCRAIVRDMFRFRVRIPLNMQTVTLRRSILASLPQPVFREPFPDHLAINALLLGDHRWVFSPERIVVVGVSPKSFGHFAYGRAAGAGLDYLGIRIGCEGMLPGDPLLNGMLQWLGMLREERPDALRGVRVDRGGYVRRQAYFWLRQARLGHVSWGECFGTLWRFGMGDLLRIPLGVLDGRSWSKAGTLFRGGRRRKSDLYWGGLEPLPSVRSIEGFSQWVTANRSLLGSAR